MKNLLTASMFVLLSACTLPSSSTEYALIEEDGVPDVVVADAPPPELEAIPLTDDVEVPPPNFDIRLLTPGD